jgi:predicted GIY-YIG superfamily endonuclease
VSRLYLLHLQPSYHHARHYLGYTRNHDLSQRLLAHIEGRGSPLVHAAVTAGCRILLAATWDGDRVLERTLKNWHNGPRLCPLCADWELLVRAMSDDAFDVLSVIARHARHRAAGARR